MWAKKIRDIEGVIWEICLKTQQAIVSFPEFWPLQYWHNWMKLSKQRPIWAWLLIPTVGPGPSTIKKYPSHYSELFLSLNWYDFSVSAKWGICIKDHWPYVNQDQDAKPQSGASSLTKVWYLDLDLHMVNGLWYTHVLNFSPLSWFWSGKNNHVL